MESIVEELRRDREAGARRLEGDYRAGLMTLARRLCADEGDAEELVNRTFAAVVEGIDNYVEQSAFFGWMCQILANIHSMDVRRKSNRVEVADADAVAAAADDGADARVFRDVDASLLRDAVETLPANMREAILLHYFLDMPVAKIARFLSIPNGTVLSRLHYARLALAAKLGTQRPGVKMLLLALLLAAGLAIGGGIYAVATAAVESHAESAELVFHAETAEPEGGSGEAEPPPVVRAENAETTNAAEGGLERARSALPTPAEPASNAAEGGLEPSTPDTPEMNAKSLLASLVPAAAIAANPLDLAFSVKGYAGSATLTNFPVLVRLTANATNRFDYADCAADGSDIRFADAAGNLIPHEIDAWDPTGESAIWVALPTMRKGTMFSMLYGPNAPAATAAGSVWSGAGFASVWHLDIDTANGYSTRDSVASYAGAVRDPSIPYATGGEGVVGGAYHCESNRGIHDVHTTAVAGFTQSADGEATLSVWFRQIGGTAQNGYPDKETYDHIYWGSQYGNCGVIVNSKNGSESGNGVEIDLGGYADQYRRLIVRDSTVTRPDIETESLYDKRWHHLAVVWDGTTRTLYFDGVLQPAATAAAVYRTPSGTVRMGARDERNTDCVWTGDLDEVRFLPAVASADWIAAEHAQVSSDSFLRVLKTSGTVIVVR